MSGMQVKATVKIAPNNPVFDLPVIVGIEEGLFAKAGLDVSFSASYADRERDNAQTAFMARLKESQFDCGKADVIMCASGQASTGSSAASVVATSRRCARRWPHRRS